MSFQILISVLLKVQAVAAAAWMPVSFYPFIVTVVKCTDKNIPELVDEVTRLEEYLLNGHR